MVMEAGAGCGLRMGSRVQLLLEVGVCVGVSRFFASYPKNRKKKGYIDLQGVSLLGVKGYYRLERVQLSRLTVDHKS